MANRSQRRVAYRFLNRYIPLSGYKPLEPPVELEPPVLTSLNPDTAELGAPDITMRCLGSGFTEESVIVFAEQDEPIVFVSANEITTGITLSLPWGAVTVPVWVRNADGQDTDILDFTFTEAVVVPPAVPILVSISPTSSPLNPLMDLELVCYGPATNVYHADMWVMMDDVRYDYESWSQAMLTLNIPKANLAVSGVRQVRVVDAAGESLPLPFTVEAAPPLEITGCIPNPIPAAHPTAVTVRGTSFDPTCEMNFDGLPLDPSQAVFVNSTTCQVTAPGIWTEGAHELMVFSYTLGNSNVLPITVSASVPVGPTLPALTSLNPATLPAGTMDWSMGVNGTGFVDGDTVYADDTPLPTSFFGVTYLNATMLASLMTVPKDIAITQRRGAETSPPLTFTVGPPLPVPAITSTSPASVVAGSPNTALTVTGTGFDDQCQIRLNGGGKSTTFVSDTQLTGVIAASLMTTAGAIAVTVNNPNAGLSNEATIAVTAAPPPAPTLTSISPTTAVAGAADTTVTLTGTNFLAGDEARLDGATVLATTFVSSTALNAVVPAMWLAAAGTIQLAVYRAGVPTASQNMTITAPPVPATPALTLINPNRVLVNSAGSWVTTIDGSNFEASAVVYFDGANPITPTAVTASRVTYDMPASLTPTVRTWQVTVKNGTSPASNALPIDVVVELYPPMGGRRKSTRSKK